MARWLLALAVLATSAMAFIAPSRVETPPGRRTAQQVRSVRSMRSRSDLAGATPTAAGGAFAVLAVAGALLRRSLTQRRLRLAGKVVTSNKELAYALICSRMAEEIGKYVLENPLRRMYKANCKALVAIKHRRGIRMQKGLPVRFQRSKTNNPTQVAELRCGNRHRFHKSCITTWMVASIAMSDGMFRCPLCRKGLNMGQELTAVERLLEDVRFAVLEQRSMIEQRTLDENLAASAPGGNPSWTQLRAAQIRALMLEDRVAELRSAVYELQSRLSLL
eukprot:g18039.t1